MFRYQRQKGFTLIEMIVSLGIFSIVAVVALGALIKIISANKKAQTLQSAMTNLNYALESMSREMRMGNNFSCYGAGDTSINNIASIVVNNCHPFTDASTGLILAFKSSHVSGTGLGACNLTYAYQFAQVGGLWTISMGKQPACNGNISTYTPMLDPNVDITGLYVNVNSETGKYPLATIRISGRVGVRELERTYFDVQTAVAARIAND